jgi:hypothetical protein
MQETDATTYSLAELEAKALNFIKRNKPPMSKAEAANLARLKAEAAEHYAKNLMLSGVWSGEAWNRAIRLEILESESD